MTAQLCPAPVFSQFTGSGAPMVGGQLFTYAAGTSTPQATYVDSTQTTPNTNPVILNSLGQANVWLDPRLAYKLVMQDAAGNPVWTVDNILGALSGAPNIVIGPPAASVALRVLGAADGSTAVVVGATVASSQPTMVIGATTNPGQSNGLLITAGANSSDLPLNIENFSLGTLMTVNGAGAVTVGAVAAQVTGSVNCSGGYYVNNVRQPIFTVALAGIGTPINPSIVAGFNGASASLVQCSGAIAQILLTLKAAGIYAA